MYGQRTFSTGWSADTKENNIAVRTKTNLMMTAIVKGSLSLFVLWKVQAKALNFLFMLMSRNLLFRFFFVTSSIPFLRIRDAYVVSVPGTYAIYPRINKYADIE